MKNSAFKNFVFSLSSVFLSLSLSPPLSVSLTPSSFPPSPLLPLSLQSDPYLKIRIGKKEISDKENYIPNNLNPLFGKMFEIPAKLPVQHKLIIRVMDYDRTSADDLIGETTIDLENRFLSNYRPRCGIPNTFCK